MDREITVGHGAQEEGFDEFILTPACMFCALGQEACPRPAWTDAGVELATTRAPDRLASRNAEQDADGQYTK